MECFGDDSDEDVLVDISTIQWLQAVLVELVPLKRPEAPMRVGILYLDTVSRSDCFQKWIENISKLRGFQIEIADCVSKLASTQYDIIVWMISNILSLEAFYIDGILQNALDLLVPGGIFISTIDFNTTLFTENVLLGRHWWPVKRGVTGVVSIRKAATDINYTAASYWSRAEDDFYIEMELLADVVICTSTWERTYNLLLPTSENKAREALLRHGIVVIKGLFDSSYVANYGRIVCGDMEACIDTLLERGVDLRSPGDGSGRRIENYMELSMREAFRCDIRNCPGLNSAAHESELRIKSDLNLPGTDLRGHPSLLRILQESMMPRGEFEKGNWGRWNFGGGGPEKRPPLVVGEVGAVVSLPGCLDQTIHADTPHVFTHVHLPPHYVNLFLPCLSADMAVMELGQTAFVMDSHLLEMSARMMTTPEGEGDIVRNLIRPHLFAGDCLLFDCRILHFGLANNPISCQLRPTLYVNYHSDWFHDPKNWNTTDQLFHKDLKPFNLN
jgi:hypothetical protein